MKMKSELSEFNFDVKYKKGAMNANEDALSRMFPVVVLDELEQEILIKENHESPLADHRAFETTFDRLKSQGYGWPRMRKDVEDFVKKSVSCQTNKLYKTTKRPLKVTDTPSAPWEKVALDIVGKLPKRISGNNLTIQDNFSKFIIAIPLEKQDAESCGESVRQQYDNDVRGSTKNFNRSRGELHVKVI